MPLNPFNKCIGVPTPQNTTFRPKMAKKIPFCYPKSVFSGSGWSISAPRTLFLGCCTHRTTCCMPLNPFINCFRAATTKNTRKSDVLHAIESI